MAYFNNFPKITYDGVTVRNILLKSALVAEVFNNAASFYPYIVKEGYRPDTVAYEVYGDPKYDWVVYFSNAVTDPYYDWPLSGDDFNKYLVSKYGKTIYELMSTIDHYEYTGNPTDTPQDIARNSYKMSPSTYSSAATFGSNVTGWSPVDVYTYETRLNDAKRSIKLLSPGYINQIEKELSKIF